MSPRPVGSKAKPTRGAKRIPLPYTVPCGNPFVFTDSTPLFRLPVFGTNKPAYAAGYFSPVVGSTEFVLFSGWYRIGAFEAVYRLGAKLLPAESFCAMAHE